MFDIGFTELVVFSVVALIVLGPKKLPLFFRTIGTLIGRAQSYVSEIKDDIKEQIELEDLSRAKQAITDLGKDVSDDISTIKGELSDVTDGVKKNIQVHQDLESKCGFFINSPALSWPEENSYVRLRDRLRERNRQRLLKNRKKN